MTIVNTVKTMNSISTRFTGLDLDPNYFSLQVLIAMACLLVLLIWMEKGEKVNCITRDISIFGILTYSKMFIITLIVFIMMTFVVFIRNNVKTAIKFSSFIVIICGVPSIFLREVIRNLLIRFLGQEYQQMPLPLVE